MKFRDIHIGKLIRQRLDQSGMAYGEFASRLCCQRHSLYYLFAQKSIDVEKLARISRILGYDFLRLYSPEDADLSQKRKGNEEKLAVVKIAAANVDSFLREYPGAVVIEFPDSGGIG